MSDIAAANLQSYYASQPSQLEQAVFLNTVDNLLENYTPSDLGHAATLLFMDSISDSIKLLIANSNMPEAVKDNASARVDEVMAELGEQCPCTAEALADLQNSELAQELEEMTQAAVDILEQACCSSESSDLSPEATAEAETEAANEAPAGDNAADGPESPAEPVTSGDEATSETEAATGAGGREQADADLDSLLAETGESPETSRSGSGKSFLEILAQSMGEAQAKMLNKALEYSNQMRDMAGDEEKADLFTIAQAQYTALMQMFNIYSNQVATTLKTAGEAMAGIARKQ